MGSKRVVWHVGFGALLRRRGPVSVEVRDEVPLSDEPPRLDYLILRTRPPLPEDPPPQTLRRLWPLLPSVSIVEYKSPSRSYRTGELDRLWSYVHAYRANPTTRPKARADLCAVLAVHARTPSLDADVQELGLSWRDLGDGYWNVEGGQTTLYVVEIDVVGPAERDLVLHSLGHGAVASREVGQFWMEIMGSKEAGMSVQELEGYDELMDKLLEALPPERVLSHYAPEQVLSHYAPEQVLSHYAPEQRLAGLDRDHQALALPLEVLRALPESYIRSLSPEAQEAIRRRLHHAGD